MPELPEVEIMTRNISNWFRDSQFEIEILDTRWLKRGNIENIQGSVVRDVRRRAKYTLICFDEYCLILHFRMTGKMVPYQKERKYRALFRAHHNTENTENTETKEQGVYGFADTRCLGEGYIISLSEEVLFFSKIGPEPWPQKLSGQQLQNCFHSKGNMAIKNALLQQDLIAGVGNILACESLYHAHISPFCPIEKCSIDEWEQWSVALVAVIHLIIEKESSDEIAYISEGGENIFEVYGREGQNCRKCQTTIVREKQAGRSTFYCPTCQKNKIQ